MTLSSKPQSTQSLPHELRGDTSPLRCDVLIVGAGPAGLFLAFELGLLGIQAHLVDSLSRVGGQAIELYGDKPIYDIPATLACTGQELTERLVQQCKPFNPQFHLDQLVQSIQALDDHFQVQTQVQTRTGNCFLAKCLVIAGGVGAFLHRPLIANGVEPFVKTQIHHGPFSRVKTQLSQFLSEEQAHLWVVGGTQEAVQDALSVYEWGQSLEHQTLQVTLIHRRETLEADEKTTQALHDALAHSQNNTPPCSLRFLHGQILHTHANPEDAMKLERVEWMDAKGVVHQSHCHAILVDLGLSPQLGPIAAWGLEMQKKQLPVNQEDYSTTTPGIFAIGDIITYPGKKKLILSGFHEATLAAYGIAKRVLMRDKIPFEYTSASALLQSRLGVLAPDNDTPSH
jgi:thioredoxin reductase (NADPH)